MMNLIAAAALSLLAASANAATTAFYFTGTPNSFVSGGQTDLISPDSDFGWSFRIIADGPDTNSIWFEVDDFNFNPDFSASTFWGLEVAAPDFGPLRPGTFTDARRYPFNDANPGLNFSGDSRGNNMLTGYFFVHELAVNPDDSISKLAIDAMQFGEFNLSEFDWISVRYNSDIPVSRQPAPIPLPSASWSLLAGLGLLAGIKRRKTAVLSGPVKSS